MKPPGNWLPSFILTRRTTTRRANWRRSPAATRSGRRPSTAWSASSTSRTTTGCSRAARSTRRAATGRRTSAPPRTTRCATCTSCTTPTPPLARLTAVASRWFLATHPTQSVNVAILQETSEKSTLKLRKEHLFFFVTIEWTHRRTRSFSASSIHWAEDLSFFSIVTHFFNFFKPASPENLGNTKIDLDDFWKKKLREKNLTLKKSRVQERQTFVLFWRVKRITKK